MFKKVILATLLATSFGSAHAYQAEVGGTINVYDFDEVGTETGFAVDGTYYFNPVQVKNNPLNEAAFLDRASNVNAEIGYIDLDYGDITTFGAGIEYFVPNSDFYLSAGIGHTTVKVDGAGNEDALTYRAEVGYLPVPGLLVAVGLDGYNDDYSDDVDPTIRAKYVTQVGGFDMNFEADAQFRDDNDYGLGADLYLDKTFSVGLAYAGSDADGFDDSFILRTKKFFTPQISLEGSVAIADHSNIYGIRGAYRF